MDEIRKPNTAETSALDQAASNAARLFLSRTGAATRAMMDWNNEAGRFISGRINRNIETLGRISQCAGQPDVFQIEADWFRTALEDYAKGANKLMEASRSLLSSAVGDTGSAATDDRPHDVGSTGPRVAAKAAA